MYGKHFASMYTGSLFGKPATVFAVWGYCIANMRPHRDGTCTVELNPILLAPMFATKHEEIRAAIDVLLSDDPLSRTDDHDGRRLVLEHGNIDGPATYLVVNGAKYRGMRDEDARREQVREAVARHRQKQPSNQRKPRKPPKAHAEAEEEAEAEGERADARPPIDVSFDARIWAQWSAANRRESMGAIQHAEIRKLRSALPADDADAITTFRTAANAYVAAQKAKGKPAYFNWLARDIGAILASLAPAPSDPNHPALQRWTPPPVGDVATPPPGYASPPNGSSASGFGRDSVPAAEPTRARAGAVKGSA